MEGKTQTTDKVMAYLKEQNKPCKLREIKEALHLTPGQVAGAIYRLKNEKKIAKVENKGYGVCVVVA